MNIIQMQEDLKDASDNQLMETMQNGSAPQYLVISEMQRRKDMRNRYNKQQQQQGSVAEDLISGIAGLPNQMQVPQDGIASFARGGKVAEMGGKEKALAVERGFEDATYKDQYTGEDTEPRKKPDLRTIDDAKSSATFADGGVVSKVKAELPRREGASGDTTGAAETGKMGLTTEQYNRIRETYGDVSEDEAIDIYMNELNSEISSLPGYDAASPSLQAALLDSAYNTGGLSEFPRLRAALAELPETGDEEAVARELLDSASIDGGTSKGIAKRRAENYNSVLNDPSRAITEVEQADDGELIYWSGDNEVFRYGQDKGRHASSEPGIVGVASPNIQMAEADTSSWKDMTPQERRQRDLDKYEAQDMPMPAGGVEMPGGRGRAVPEPAPEKAEGLEALAQANNRGLPGAQSGVTQRPSSVFTGEDTQVARYAGGGIVELADGSTVEFLEDGRTTDDARWEAEQRRKERYENSPVPEIREKAENFRLPTKDQAGQWAKEAPGKIKDFIASDIEDGRNFFRDSVFPYWDEKLNFSGTKGKPQGIENIPVEQAPGADEYTTVDAQAEAAEKQLLQQRDPQAEVDPQVDPYLEELRKRRADTTVGGRERLSEFLMATGIGMMASDDPDTLRNLGVGGMKGLEALQNLKKDERARLQSLDQQEGAYNRQVSSNEAALRKAQLSGGADPYKAVGDYGDAVKEYRETVQTRQKQLMENPLVNKEDIPKMLRDEAQDPSSPLHIAARNLAMAESQLERHRIPIPTSSAQLHSDITGVSAAVPVE